MNINGLLIVGFGSLLLASAACITCWIMTTRLRRLRKRTQDMVSLVERDLRLSALTLKDTDSRVAALERHARTLKDAQHHLESRAGGAANYGQAITLVQRGWRTEDLVSGCGLTRGEAELVYLLHGPGGALKSKGLPINL